MAQALVDAWNHSIHEFTVILPSPSGKSCANKPIQIPEIAVEGKVPKTCDMGWSGFFTEAHKTRVNHVKTSRDGCAAALGMDQIGMGGVARDIIKMFFDKVAPNPAIEYCKEVLAASFEDQTKACVVLKGVPHYRKSQNKCMSAGQSFPLALDAKRHVLTEYTRWLSSTGRGKDLK